MSSTRASIASLTMRRSPAVVLWDARALFFTYIGAWTRAAVRAAATASTGAVVACAVANVAAAADEARTALVIGNSAYDSAPLVNTANDAEDMGQALREMGFEVEVAIDQDRRQMKLAVRRFRDRLKARGGVGLFYYAGHGMEVRGENYLIPVGVEIEGEEYVDLEAVPMGEVMAGLEQARNRMNIVILDACRNNPFARSWRSSSRGLAVMASPAETIIAYATSPGQVASDNPGGRNGLYTSKLLKSMRVPGLRLIDVFRRTRLEVKQASRGGQIPWQSENLTSAAFYFVPGQGPSSESTLSLEDLERSESERQAQIDEWTERLEAMRADYERVQRFESTAATAASRIAAWERFLSAYAEDDPHSSEDDALRLAAARELDGLRLGGGEPQLAVYLDETNGRRLQARGELFGPQGEFLGGCELESLRSGACRSFDEIEVEWYELERNDPSFFGDNDRAPEIYASLQICTRFWGSSRCTEIDRSGVGNTGDDGGGLNAHYGPRKISVGKMVLRRDQVASAWSNNARQLLDDLPGQLEANARDRYEDRYRREAYVKERMEEALGLLETANPYLHVALIHRAQTGLFGGSKDTPVGCLRMSFTAFARVVDEGSKDKDVITQNNRAAREKMKRSCGEQLVDGTYRPFSDKARAFGTISFVARSAAGLAEQARRDVGKRR